MDCHDAKERILEGRRGAGVSRHLHLCPDCAAYEREVESGGREIAEAFLAGSPSPGFEDRVGRVVSEREITVPIPLRPAGSPVRVLLPVVLVLLAVAGWMLLDSGNGSPPVENPPAPPAPRPAAVTDAHRENILHLTLRRERSAGPTLMEIEFAGDHRTIRLAEQVEGALLTAWARGARRVRLIASPEVPGREVFAVQEVLEMAGFSYDLVRPKDRPAPGGSAPR